jgi:hypothetical protein
MEGAESCVFFEDQLVYASTDRATVRMLQLYRNRVEMEEMGMEEGEDGRDQASGGEGRRRQEERPGKERGEGQYSAEGREEVSEVTREQDERAQAGGIKQAKRRCNGFRYSALTVVSRSLSATWRRGLTTGCWSTLRKMVRLAGLEC